MEKLKSGKDGGNNEGSVLVMKGRLANNITAKVDANSKLDAPNDPNASNINTPNIDIPRGIGKNCAVVMVMS